jgi:gas vesicle protein
MAKKSQGDQALWFFAGAAIGATIALLYAPQPGTETREQLRGAARKGADQLAETGRHIADLGRELYDRGRQLSEDANSMFERGKKLIDDAEFADGELEEHA